MIWKLCIFAVAVVGLTMAVPPQSEQQGRRTIDMRCVAEKCTLHEERLQNDIVTIRYNWHGLPPGWADARIREFPFSNLTVLGGGGVILRNNLGIVWEKPEYAKVKYCQHCRHIEQAYWISWEEETRNATPVR
jgi:hypothetical protein